MVLLREAKQHSDAGLVEECLRGDSSAFDELVRRYKDRVYNVVYRFLGNHEDAQDVAQEVFVRAYKSLNQFEGRAKVYTWLYSIAANLSRNRLRDTNRKGRNRGTSFEAREEAGRVTADGNASPRDQVQAAELEEVLQACLDELPDHYRITFVLRTFEDLSYDEIADAMGVTLGTVKSRLNQARRMLRDRLRSAGVM